MMPSKELIWMSMPTMLLLGTVIVANAGTPAEECCNDMDQISLKYFTKHLKKANKCTVKMDASADPGGERCDNTFDSVTGGTDGQGTDFIIDKLRQKSLKKMKKKCMKRLGIDEATLLILPVLPSPCLCNIGLNFLPEQMDCKLSEVVGPADTSTCVTSPAQENANRGAAPPPAVSTFCP